MMDESIGENIKMNPPYGYITPEGNAFVEVRIDFGMKNYGIGIVILGGLTRLTYSVTMTANLAES